MPDIGYAGLPVPEGADAPAGPGALAELAEAVDPHLWQHVTSLADRNTRLPTAPVRTVAVGPDGTTWIKVATANTWITLWEPLPAWRPLSLASGYQAGTITPQITIRNGRQVHLRGRIARTDGTPIVGTNSIQIGTVPADCIPTVFSTSSAYYSLTGDPVIGAGRLETKPATDANPGELSFWSQDGAQDGGTVGAVWVDISGSYWLD